VSRTWGFLKPECQVDYQETEERKWGATKYWVVRVLPVVTAVVAIALGIYVAIMACD
jgi:hypothetical protein